MAFWGTIRSVGEALGVWQRTTDVGCSLGRVAFRETKRSAEIVNLRRPRRGLLLPTQQMLGELFPDLDVSKIRIRDKCRLPANRFKPTGSIYAMTFGYTIYWRDELDEQSPRDLVKLIHEVVHVDQVRRHGGEDGFACAYGRGYLDGGGTVPPHIKDPGQYHRNPLEAEAYQFDSKFRDERGRVVASRLPGR